MKVVNSTKRAGFAVHEVFNKDRKAFFPKYPEDLDTLDCWCFSHFSVMYEKDLENYKKPGFM